MTLRFSGTFTGLEEPDSHYLPVPVPAGVAAIEVRYCFSQLETGLGVDANVVEIGIFDHDRFRGRSDGARGGFRVATDSATEGFLGGVIDAGDWRVALEPLAVIPPGVAWEVEVTLCFGPAPDPLAPAIALSDPILLSGSWESPTA